MSLAGFARLQTAENRLIPALLADINPAWLLEIAPLRSSSPALDQPRSRLLLDAEGVGWPFRARLDAVDRSRSATRRSFSHGAKTGADGTEDKSIIRAILGRRIEVIYYCINIGKNRPMGHLGFAFSDGTAFEFIVFGRTYACNKMESFDLSSTIHRGNGIYENELLAFQDPDSDGIAMPINRPHQWSDLDT